jgi:hypothetical protein
MSSVWTVTVFPHGKLTWRPSDQRPSETSEGIPDHNNRQVVRALLVKVGSLLNPSAGQIKISGHSRFSPLAGGLR